MTLKWAIAPKNWTIPIIINTYFIPKINELNKSLPGLEFITGSTSELNPEASIVAATIAVDIAIPETLPEFLERFTNAETTPWLFLDTEEKIDALLGGIKIADPKLNIMIDVIRYKNEVSAFIKPNIIKPIPDNTRPVVVKIFTPYLSEYKPEKGPKIILATALGTKIKETCAALYLKAACKKNVIINLNEVTPRNDKKFEPTPTLKDAFLNNESSNNGLENFNSQYINMASDSRNIMIPAKIGAEIHPIVLPFDNVNNRDKNISVDNEAPNQSNFDDFKSVFWNWLEFKT